MDFLLVFVQLFSLGVTAEALRVNMAVLFQRGQFGSKFQVQGVVPTNHFSRRKTMINVLSYGLRMWAHVCFVTMHAFERRTGGQTDRRTYGRTERPSQYRVLHYMQSRRTARNFVPFPLSILYIFQFPHSLYSLSFSCLPFPLIALYPFESGGFAARKPVAAL